MTSGTSVFHKTQSWLELVHALETRSQKDYANTSPKTEG
jgi:hypothetical protein